uniref:Uncharacterized protein n=1 Tax=Physcomitrium patens TaxID=3218 RepID=A0A2K1JGH2_PHYPA|nr:hypothetical protein PHYPA_018021 [Physcomitrium patens]
MLYWVDYLVFIHCQTTDICFKSKQRRNICMRREMSDVVVTLQCRLEYKNDVGKMHHSLNFIICTSHTK